MVVPDDLPSVHHEHDVAQGSEILLGMALHGDDIGSFGCVPGFPVGTTLNGVYARMNDICGPVNEAAVCGEGLDLGVSGGADCAVAPGRSAGNTAATRTIFYHLNRVQEKARYWLPNLVWHNGPFWLLSILCPSSSISSAMRLANRKRNLGITSVAGRPNLIFGFLCLATQIESLSSLTIGR